MTFVEARQSTKFSLCFRVKTGFGIDRVLYSPIPGARESELETRHLAVSNPKTYSSAPSYVFIARWVCIEGT
jgi:hypothetical protein